MPFKPCTRCDGKGTIARYSKISGGQCFKCKGTGEVFYNDAAGRAAYIAQRMAEDERKSKLPPGAVPNRRPAAVAFSESGKWAGRGVGAPSGGGSSTRSSTSTSSSAPTKREPGDLSDFWKSMEG